MPLDEVKLGKLPATPGAVTFKFSKYWDPSVLPAPPAEYGHEDLIGSSWGMLGNDRIGDCVLAGAAHEHMLWTKMGGASDASFTTQNVISDYSAITGYSPFIPFSDRGTDMAKAAEYRRTTGIIDAAGVRHKVDAYLAIDPGNLDALRIAMWLFGAVGIGIEMPGTAIDQTRAHQSWHVIAGAGIEGGHYVPGVALRGNFVVVTWGMFQAVRPSFLLKYMDEGLAYLTPEMLTAGRSPEGFDYDTLRADLAKLPAAP